ncbi:hypothetical protein B0H10DRAFT_2009822 [Mycena sp. CBHHK59/15]|nr:hypothetical protein B0H10DRAFT_2009822 [Mycena sp. CBHHK59/15]
MSAQPPHHSSLVPFWDGSGCLDMLVEHPYFSRHSFKICMQFIPLVDTSDNCFYGCRN